ncbi:MAG: hypothetical protein EXQ58_05310 [Acidobacteria bacterium]|nr:hypothetical protein [Acidobacteriota bacterium]
MAGKKITIGSKKARRGKHMTKASRWRLAAVTGRNRVFVGTLLQTINVGNLRLAIFKVPK